MNRSGSGMYQKVVVILMFLMIILMPGCISDDDSIDNTTSSDDDSIENTTSVDYIGFMDNSSIYGYRMDPGNFSQVHIPINEENCSDEYSNPLCVKDYGGNITYNETLGCLSRSNDTHEECIEGSNMSISGRVMWWDVGYSDSCAVFINSEQFIPSNTYNLSAEDVTWDELWADPAYVAWDSERMAAYNAEIGNQPSWCSDPVLDYYYITY